MISRPLRVDILQDLGIELDSLGLYVEAGECYQKAIKLVEDDMERLTPNGICQLIGLWGLRAHNFRLRDRIIDGKAADRVRRILEEDLKLLQSQEIYQPKEIFIQPPVPKKIDRAYKELHRRKEERMMLNMKTF